MKSRRLARSVGQKPGGDALAYVYVKADRSGHPPNRPILVLIQVPQSPLYHNRGIAPDRSVDPEASARTADVPYAQRCLREAQCSTSATLAQDGHGGQDTGGSQLRSLALSAGKPACDPRGDPFFRRTGARKPRVSSREGAAGSRGRLACLRGGKASGDQKPRRESRRQRACLFGEATMASVRLPRCFGIWTRGSTGGSTASSGSSGSGADGGLRN